MSRQPIDRKCWENGTVFQSEKVLLQISLNPPIGPPVIDICQCQSSFGETFGFADNLPMNLEDMISHANDAQDVADLLHAIRIRSPHSTFISLRDARGVDLACYLQVSMGYKADNLIQPSSVDPRGIPRDHTAILTIRSASAVGNVPVINVLVNASLVEDPATQRRVLAAVNERIDLNIASAQQTALMGSATARTKATAKTTAKAAPARRTPSSTVPSATAPAADSTSSTTTQNVTHSPLSNTTHLPTTASTSSSSSSSSSNNNMSTAGPAPSPIPSIPSTTHTTTTTTHEPPPGDDWSVSDWTVSVHTDSAGATLTFSDATSTLSDAGETQAIQTSISDHGR